VPRSPRRRVDAFTTFLRAETTGGQLLVLATVVALVWANADPGGYEGLWGARLAVGPDWLHLDLTAAGWVTDGLLAVFFFVAGLEVKRELTVGELAGWRAAALPLAAAAGGMVTPALVALAASRGALAAGGGWAVPVATDIAFALGVLALAGSALPPGVRVLLLSMAVIDDLGAIALIAAVFTHGLQLWWLAGAAGLFGLFRLAGHWSTRWRLTRWAMLPIAVASWVCLHASGVHATVAGIALGLLVRVRLRPGEVSTPAERLEYRLHPLSAGLIVPLFAVAAAGVPLGAAADALTDPAAHGIAAGLLLGKFAGILAGAWLAVRVGIGTLPAGVRWADVVPVAVLGGIGYTVSLLVVRLSFADGAAQERAATAVLGASVVAALAAVTLLRLRARSDRAAAKADRVAVPD